MESVLSTLRSTALLLRGTEGEPVADPRRTPKMTSIATGKAGAVEEHQSGPLMNLPSLPAQCAAASTAQYIQSVLQGNEPVPIPIALQVERVVELAHTL
jgi:anthranilate phosphoribosyltransferase